MFLYRALNKDDVNNYNNGEYILCSLYNAELNKELKRSVNYDAYYNLCLDNKRKFAIDSIVGHIGGKRLGVNISPWVSTSSDFNFVLEEYAIPQSGTYNYQNERKPILVINIDNDKVLNSSEEIKRIRETYENDFAIDLRNGLLNDYYKTGAVSSEKYNKYMPGYDYDADMDKEMLDKEMKVSGFANYSTASSEVLFYGGINKKYQMFIIYPLLQDIIYSLNTDINKMLPFIVENITDIESLLEKLYSALGMFYKILYPSIYEGINLTDYLIGNYDNIKGNSIEEKYESLKKAKLELLNTIVNEINKKFNSEFKASRVVDDNILVSSYDNLKQIPKSLKHDIILIEKDNKLYKYNSKDHYYINGNDKISKGDVCQLVKGKSMLK